MMRTLPVMLLLILAVGCVQSRSATTSGSFVSYDRAQDVTNYSTPFIPLLQTVNITRHRINLEVLGACEGEHTHCRPGTLLWRFEPEAGYDTFHYPPRLELVVDGQYHSFTNDRVVLTPRDVAVEARPEFYVPFDFTERVVAAGNVEIILGGHGISFGERRRAPIRRLLATIQGEDEL